MQTSSAALFLMGECYARSAASHLHCLAECSRNICSRFHLPIIVLRAPCLVSAAHTGKLLIHRARSAGKQHQAFDHRIEHQFLLLSCTFP